jgi:hypothetical protein
VPTASFGTLFNEQEARERSTDRHTLADVEYSRAIGLSHLTVRGSFVRFSYDGAYPFAGEVSGAVQIGHNSALGTRWSAGVRLTRALPQDNCDCGAEFTTTSIRTSASLWTRRCRCSRPTIGLFSTRFTCRT